MTYFEPPPRLPTPEEAKQLAERGARFEVVIDSALGVSPSLANWSIRPRSPLGRLPHTPDARAQDSLLAVLAIEQRKRHTRTGADAVRHTIRLLALSAKGCAQAALRAHTLPTIAEIVAHTFDDNNAKQLEHALVRHMHAERLQVAPAARGLETHLLHALVQHTPDGDGESAAGFAAELIAHLVAHAIEWSRHRDAVTEGALQ